MSAINMPRNAEPRWLTGGIAAADCIAAYEPDLAVDLAASYVNLANPGTYDAAPGTAPTLVAGGWSFVNGSSQYLTTNIAPTSGMSALIRFSSWTRPAGPSTLLGAFGSASVAYVIQSTTGTNLRTYKSTVADNSTNVTSGVVAIAAQRAYLNGFVLPNTMTAGSLTSLKLFIGGLNNGSAIQFATVTIARIYIYLIDITAYMAGLTTAINS